MPYSHKICWQLLFILLNLPKNIFISEEQIHQYISAHRSLEGTVGVPCMQLNLVVFPQSYGEVLVILAIPGFEFRNETKIVS